MPETISGVDGRHHHLTGTVAPRTCVRRFTVSCGCAALLSWLGCGHDTDRANPLDAELTPPVTLTASQDSAGVVTLAWSRYAGDQPFADYLVLRNVARSIDVDTLATVDDVASTVFIDSILAASTAYEYRVAVRNRHGLLSHSQSQRVEGFATRAVTLAPTQADPRAGTVRLLWSAYRDPGFERYEIFRRAAGTDADSLIGIRPDASDTTLVDTTALHGINYVYRTDVVAAGQQLAGFVVDGRVDLPTVDLDSLALNSSTATAALRWQPYAGPRFSAYEIWRTRGDERTRAGIETDPEATAFLDAGLTGGVNYVYEIHVVTTRQERIPGASRNGSMHALVDEWPLGLTRSSAATRASARLYVEGDRLQVLRSESLSNGVIVERADFDLTGSVLGTTEYARLPIIVDGFDARDIALATRNGHALLTTTGLSGRTPGLLALASPPPGQSVTVDLNLAAPALSPTLAMYAGEGRMSVWDIYVISEGDSVFRSPGLRFASNRLEFLYKDDGDWGVYGVLFDAATPLGSGVTAQMGDATSGRLTFELSSEEIRLEYDDAEGNLTAATERLPGYVDLDRRSISILPTATGFRATVTGHDLWSQGTGAQRETGTSLTGFRDSHLFTIGMRAYVLSSDDSVRQLSSEFASAVREMRTWSVIDSRSPSVGVCLPDLDIVHFNEVFRASDWQRLVSNRTVGPLLDGSGGRLLYPLSLDGSSDGRVYVLDAGNSRVVVLDVNGNYVTQFGSAGSGPGQFDFLRGERLGNGLNYAGSIAVDDDGFIYVADVGNGRIQKFAP